MTGKEYVYKVSNATNTYIGVWKDVIDEPEFTQRINTPGTTMTVKLGRSANNTIQSRDGWVDSTSDQMVDSTGDSYTFVSVTNNTVGAGTDVDLNYNVDIFVIYGGFDNWVTQTGEQFTDSTGDSYVFAVGAPLGRRIFSGLIIDYEANYGDGEWVTVTLASNGFELSNEVIRSGATTTVNFSSQTHDTIVKNILDTNPGKMTYTAASIAPTGTPITVKYQLNTKLEGIDDVFEQTDAGWYWFGHVGENTVYLKQKSATAQHTFVQGKHIKTVAIKRSMENLKNTVYFVGGDTGGGAILYKKYTDAPSLAAWRQGLERITDRRYTLTASALRRANKVMARYAAPIYTTTIEVTSATYDIEGIQLGDVVGFSNFGNFIDGLLLQVVSLSYTPTTISLQLGDLLDRQQDVISDVADGLENEQFVTLPTAPS